MIAAEPLGVLVFVGPSWASPAFAEVPAPGEPRGARGPRRRADEATARATLRAAVGATGRVSRDGPLMAHGWEPEQRMTNPRRITADQADEIRRRHRDKGASIYALAAAFGIAPQTVSRILSYEIHRPRDRRVVPLLMTRRDHALLVLRAEERGVGTVEMAAEIFAVALAVGGPNGGERSP